MKRQEPRIVVSKSIHELLKRHAGRRRKLQDVAEEYILTAARVKRTLPPDFDNEKSKKI